MRLKVRCLTEERVDSGEEGYVEGGAVGAKGWKLCDGKEVSRLNCTLTKDIKSWLAWQKAIWFCCLLTTYLRRNQEEVNVNRVCITIIKSMECLLGIGS